MTTPDLLIIGAGPVGLTLACEARRHGLSVRIIDKRATASIHSKAQLVHARTLEMLEDMDIAERFVERGIEIHSFNLYQASSTKRFASMAIAGLDSKYQGMLSIPQHDTEVILAEHLASLDVNVERQVRLERFTQDEDKVTATLIHEADNEREEILDVPWLAGCDGAHSTVRHALELTFEGHRYPMHVIQSDARVDFPFEVHNDEVLGFPGPGNIVGLFPLPHGENRYRVLVPRLSDEDIEPTLQDFQDVIDKVCPPGSKISDPHWMVGFRIHCRMTPTFHVDRVFLAGDAGHIHSPAGGQGMNMGMQDSYNLAWKLALYHHGKGTKALLDSYTQERNPVAAETLRWTDRLTQNAPRMMGLKNPLVLEARNQIAGFVTSLGLVQQKVSRVFSMLDVAYHESPICGEARSDLLAANITLDKRNENPSVRSWQTFSGGPNPGHRAPDAFINATSQAPRSLFDLFRGTHHTLLLFDGAADTDDGYKNLEAIANAIEDTFGTQIATHLITPHHEKPQSCPHEGSTILDPTSEIHSAYGAQTECLYLIRPDGYVGFRSQPARLEPLMEHLKRTFT